MRAKDRRGAIVSGKLKSKPEQRKLPFAQDPAVSMLQPGAGDRHPRCWRYDQCLTAYARAQGGAQGHCPTACPVYHPTDEGFSAETTYAAGDGPTSPPPVWWGTADEHDEPEPPARHTYTHEEIAKELGVTREKVRAIEAMAMRKVRARMLARANALLN